MRRVPVHQPAGGGEDADAAAGRAPEPGHLPGLLPQRVPRLLHHRESGRAGRPAERSGARARLPVLHERSPTRLLRRHRVLRLHPHQREGQRGQDHVSRGRGRSGGSSDRQPRVPGQ